MLIKSLLAPKKLWFGLALGWTLLIAVLCLVSFDELPKLVSEKGADKLGHLSFHFVFVLLWYLYFKQHTVKSLPKIVLASVLYGLAIELMQAIFTTTRQADLNDVFANAFGATLAVIVILLFQKYVASKRTIKS